MMNVEKLFEGKGGYVFVSHSHLDIEKVRRIRNFLEKEGVEPILFYLRCMDGQDEEKLASLKKLIFDEIDAREFFLYINSENAATSQWVQEELAYIRATRPGSIATVDLSDGDEITEQTLLRMVRGMRVFISASQYDKALVRRLTDALVKHDFRVYDAERSMAAGALWDESISHTITDLANEGFVIALITDSSIRSDFFVQELKAAFSDHVPVLPIVVGTYPIYFIPDELPELRRLSVLMLSDDPTDEEIAEVGREAAIMRNRIQHGWKQTMGEP